MKNKKTNKTKNKKNKTLSLKKSQHMFAHKSRKIPYNTIFSSTFQEALEAEMLKFILSILP